MSKWLYLCLGVVITLIYQHAFKDFLTGFWGDNFKNLGLKLRATLWKRWDNFLSYKDRKNRQRLIKRLARYTNELEKLKAEWAFTAAELELYNVGRCIVILLLVLSFFTLSLVSLSWETIMDLFRTHLSPSDIKAMMGIIKFSSYCWGGLFFASLRYTSPSYKRIPKQRQARINELERRIENLRNKSIPSSQP